MKSHKKIIFILFLIFFISLILLIYNLIKENKQKAYTFPILPNTQANSYLTSDITPLIEAYKNKKILVLTFDDGPGQYTKYLVDELNNLGIHATFFILGTNIEKNEEILAYTAKTQEVAIHSYSHSLFTKLSNDEILEDISKVKNLILDITGIDTNIIRVPYGSLNSRISTLLYENNYTTIKWDVDSKDWSFRNVDKTFNYTMKQIKRKSDYPYA